MPRRRVAKKSDFNLKFLKISCLLLLSIIIIIWLYQNRLAIAYYFSFKSKNASQLEKIDQARIRQLANLHPNKIFGLDVSEYQGNINWQLVDSIAQNPIRFVLVRATAGKDRLDKTYYKNWQALQSKNMILGVYHYYRPNENSTAQAQFFIKHVKLQKGHLPPVLDIENLPNIQSVDNLKKGLKNWLTLVEAHYHIKPIIYTSESYYRDYLKHDFSEYTFWIANYNHWIDDLPNQATFWQFTEHGQAKGIKGPVDVNLFDGNLLDLQKFTIQ